MVVMAIVTESTAFLRRLIDGRQIRLSDAQEISQLQTIIPMRGVAYTKELQVVYILVTVRLFLPCINFPFSHKARSFSV